jgi:ribA/ribD-fused uncharacterized protein
MTEIVFTKVRLPYGWLGNMSPHPVTHEGINYPTAEAMFQALRFGSIDIRRNIAAIKSPMAAKMYAKGRRREMTVDPQSDEDIENMRLVLRTKFTQHPYLRAELILTGDAKLIEDVTNRQRGSGLFWGMAKRANGTWFGANSLGDLLEFVRSEIVGDL